MWIVPLAMGALAMFVHNMAWEFDLWARWGGFGYTPDGARGISGVVDPRSGAKNKN
jgi:hypothetical protein